MFMYHRFGEDDFPATSVTLDAFEAQLQWLEDNDAQVIGLEQLLAFLASGTPLPERAVVLTIDDAYASIHAEAWPLLRARGWPFTVFVATDPVDAGFGDYLDWPRLRELAAAGVTLANHGASHAHLATPLAGESEAERAARVRADLLKGARRLQEEISEAGGAAAEGAVIEGVFAYPYGEYDPVVAGVVQSLGWVAFGQQSGAVGAISDRRALPRFPINERYSDLGEFATKALSRPLGVARIEPWNPVTGPEPVLEVWLDPVGAELAELACYVGGQGRVAVEWQVPDRQFRVRPKAALTPGRQRVNCTAPGSDGRYHWFSHQWLVQP